MICYWLLAETNQLVYQFKKHLLGVSCVPGQVLGVADTFLCSQDLPGEWGRQRGEPAQQLVVVARAGVAQAPGRGAV